MAKYQLLIITNNPLVNNILDAVIEPVRGNCIEVFRRVYSKVAQGHSLLSHPLAGSIKPNQNPYKSVLLSARPEEVSISHLHLAHHCLEKIEEMLSENYQLPGNDEDLQLIDRELLWQALPNDLKAGD